MNAPGHRAALALLFVFVASPLAADLTPESAQADRGRYLVRIAGCNDCHTANYAMLEGAVPDSEWLKGDPLGWRGPWGTTYAPNLRLTLSRMTEDQWVVFARNLRSRPPMPSANLNDMSEEDLRAVYAFVRRLQPVGEPVPPFVPPGQEPATAWISLEPQGGY